MTTSKRSSFNAKSGNNNKATIRQKGLAHFKSILTLAVSEGNKRLADSCKRVIECLEQKVKDEKEE